MLIACDYYNASQWKTSLKERPLFIFYSWKPCPLRECFLDTTTDYWKPSFTFLQCDFFFFIQHPKATQPGQAIGIGFNLQSHRAHGHSHPLGILCHRRWEGIFGSLARKWSTGMCDFLYFDNSCCSCLFQTLLYRSTNEMLSYAWRLQGPYYVKICRIHYIILW